MGHRRTCKHALAERACLSGLQGHVLPPSPHRGACSAFSPAAVRCRAYPPVASWPLASRVPVPALLPGFCSVSGLNCPVLSGSGVPMTHACNPRRRARPLAPALAPVPPPHPPDRDPRVFPASTPTRCSGCASSLASSTPWTPRTSRSCRPRPCTPTSTGVQWRCSGDGRRPPVFLLLHDDSLLAVFWHAVACYAITMLPVSLP